MMFNLFDRLFPGDDPASNKRWRSTVGYLLLILITGVGALTTAATTGLPRVGALVWAGEVDQSVKKVISPIEQKLVRVEQSVNQQSQTSKSLLARITSDQIDQLVKRRCKSLVSDEIEYLSKEIRRLGEEYSDLQERDYRVLTCEEITYKEKVR